MSNVKCQILMKIDVKVVSISSMNHTEIIGKIRKYIYIKYKDFWDGEGGRVANSHAYGVILTHWTCYSRTHAIDKFTHAFKRNHTHTHAIL